MVINYDDMKKSIAAALAAARREQKNNTKITSKKKSNNTVSPASKTTKTKKTLNAKAKTGGSINKKTPFSQSKSSAMNQSISSSFKKARAEGRDAYPNTSKSTVDFHYDNLFAPKIDRAAERESIRKALRTPQTNENPEFNRQNVINELNAKAIMMSNFLTGSKGLSGWMRYKVITDDELKTYANLEGKAKDEYLNMLDPILDKRMADAVGENVQNLDNTAKKNVLTTLMGFGAGYDESMKGFEQVVRGAFGDEKPVQRSILGEVQKQVAPTLEGGAKFANDFGYSGGMMIPAITVGVATGGAGAAPIVANAVGAGVTGVASAGSTYGNTVEEGYTPDQARVYGLINGALEGGLQFAFGGIKDLSSGDILKTVSKNLGKKLVSSPVFVQKVASMEESVGYGFTEDWLKGVIDSFVRNSVLGENNDTNPFTWDKLYQGIIGAVVNVR